MNQKITNKVFDSIIIIITLVSIALCLLPFIHVISISLSSNHAIISSKVSILPVELDISAYKAILKDNSMIHSLFFTVGLTVLYTVIAMAMTICAAYPLTKKRLIGRNFFMVFIIITMYFSGGMIPDYLLIKDLDLINKMWSLILPGAISAYYMIILKTFFSSSIPDSLEESAYLDGCSDIGVLIKIVLPLSLPVLATLSLFYAVLRWNGFMDALMYITDPKMSPLQLKLYQIVYNNMALDIAKNEGVTSEIATEALKSACIIFATVPILVVYPWLQKYFVSGVMIGAVKG